jgi:adenylyltransferase/sulfurtransferase
MSTPLVEPFDAPTDRYETLRLIDWWNQTRLRQARVLVAGVGAIGNEVLKDLALLGVGRVFLADRDCVEMSNLSRSVLFRASDVGRAKVEVAAERLRELNPDVRVAVWSGDLETELGHAVYGSVDVVLGCLDNRAARLAVNRACWRVGVPYIDAGIDVLAGTVRVFVPPNGACYECTLTADEYLELPRRHSCPVSQPSLVPAGRVPTTPLSAAVTAAMQVQEAVKLLHGHEVPAGAGIHWSGQSHRLSVITYARRDDCDNHDPPPPVHDLPEGVADLTVGELLDRAAAVAGGPVVLKCDREVVRAFTCRKCGDVEAVYRPFAEVVPAGAACPKCGADRAPDAVTHVGRGAAGVPLRQLGVPPGHVVRVAAGRREFALALTGDLPALLSGWDVTKT